jgi:hypothetical protein
MRTKYYALRCSVLLSFLLLQEPDEILRGKSQQNFHQISLHWVFTKQLRCISFSQNFTKCYSWQVCYFAIKYKIKANIL